LNAEPIGQIMAKCSAKDVYRATVRTVKNANYLLWQLVLLTPPWMRVYTAVEYV
jgi:hypothetical protein